MADNRTMEKMLQAPHGRPVAFKVSTTSNGNSSSMDARIDKLTDTISNLVESFNKKMTTPATVKAVEETCVIYGGAHPYYDCIATDSNISRACVTTGTYNQGNTRFRPQPSPASTSSKMPEVTSDTPKPTIPYPSRVTKQKLREKDDNLALKFVEIFRNLHFELSFTDALLYMSKFALMFKILLNNKEKLFDLATTPVKENCSAVILKKLPEKLETPLSLPDLSSTQMLLELANRSTTRPAGIAEDVFVKVGKTGRALIDVYGEELTLRIDDEAITFKVGQTLKYSYNDAESINQIDVINVACEEYVQDVLGFFDNSKSGNPTPTSDPIIALYSPSLTSFEGGDFILEEIEACLTSKSIPPGIDDTDFDLPWVSPVHCVPKKGGMTVVVNEDNELIPTRLVTGWRVCIDYRKLNDATRKDHFPLPFIDQMLEHLARNEFYCFLDGFFGYFQIPIDPQDQENTTFTCPYGMFAYRHMPFVLCNAPGTFQMCMMAIFHDMLEKTIETIVYTDHSDLKYLLAKQDAKLRLLRWILLLQEFDVIIRDKKGAENLATDHLSRLENPYQDDIEKKESLRHFLSRLLERLLFVVSRVPYERTIGENHASWSDKLDDALWAFRTTFKTPIGCTPYKLVYEKACHLPIKLEHKAYWALKHCNFELKTAGDHRKVQLNELNKLRDQAYENSLIYKEKTKKIHDSKIKNRVFNVGNQVLLFNSRLKIFSRKLKTR
nr:reverse transcriptase domain-containing protein [Tanacetum cinerariifolium]